MIGFNSVQNWLDFSVFQAQCSAGDDCYVSVLVISQPSGTLLQSPDQGSLGSHQEILCPPTQHYRDLPCPPRTREGFYVLLFRIIPFDKTPDNQINREKF